MAVAMLLLLPCCCHAAAANVIVGTDSDADMSADATS
jgi:hypothetical protein